MINLENVSNLKSLIERVKRLNSGNLRKNAELLSYPLRYSVLQQLFGSKFKPILYELFSTCDII